MNFNTTHYTICSMCGAEIINKFERRRTFQKMYKRELPFKSGFVCQTCHDRIMPFYIRIPGKWVQERGAFWEWFTLEELERREELPKVRKIWV